MKVLSIDKNLNATNGEFINVLKRLGYHDVTKNEKMLQFRHERFDSVVQIAALPTSDKILKAVLASYSSLLFWQGIIKDEQEIVRMIEQDRKETTQKAKA
jgi:hypothetical protein